MAHCMVTLSANAGISLVLGQTQIWIDALHQEKANGFSTVSPALRADMARRPAFQSPDLICFTHCHKDHYSAALALEALREWPDTTLIHPDAQLGQGLLLDRPAVEYNLNDIQFSFFQLPHAGKDRDSLPHYGLVITRENFRILVAGDCEVASPALTNAVDGRSVDLAILNFPWLTLPRGRAFLQEHLRPRHLLLCHIPFPQDDAWGYRKAVERDRGKLSGIPDVRLLLEPLQSEII